jgi:two-component SAPR family response regulator
MRVILIDDEPVALDLLQKRLSVFEGIDIAGRYTCPMEALSELRTTNPDVVFLDIEMGEIDGLLAGDLIYRALSNVEIVFVTAYSEYAVDAFETNAIDYLLKPDHEKRLHKTIDRLNKKLTEKKKEIELDSTDSLTVYSFGHFVVLDPRGEILTWRTKKAKELFAYLWINGGKHVLKTAIIDNLFGDKNMEQATTLLHTTVYQLRNAMKRLGYHNGITYLNEGYCLNIPIKSDFKELRALLDVENPKENELRKILSIYKGDFIEEGYHWSIETQQAYKNKIYIFLKGYVSKQIDDKKFSPFVKDCLDQMSKIDPIDEDAICLTIIYFGEQNRKTELDSAYKNYEFILKAEIGIEPTEEIYTLYKKYIGSIHK